MAYIGVSPSNGVRRVHTYTATASQTTFSGAGAEGTSLSYKDSNYVDVYQNGIKLGDADYTSTSGTSIVLAQGASVDDIVVVVVFDVFSVADTVSKADGGTFDGNVTMGGTLGVTGVPTFTGRSVHSGGITIANDGQIGSVGDADAMAISSGGVVTFSQPPVGTITTTNSGGLSISGGAAADFTSLPSGIKRIFVNFYGVSAGSDTGALIRLGTSSGFVSSGYGSISHYGGGGQSDSSGFFIAYTNGANSINGTVIINHMGNNVFVSSHSVMYNTSNGAFGGGYKDLGATLTQLTVRSVSGGNFDAGLVNIMYQL